MATPTGRSSGRPKGASTEPTANHSEDGIPTPPTGLKTQGKKDWDKIWTVASWLHREQHYLLVRNYCSKVDEIDSWNKELSFFKKNNKAKHGVELSTYEQANGSWASYPQVRLIEQGRAQLVAWLGEMKLSPSHLPDGNDDNELIAALMQQNRG